MSKVAEIFETMEYGPAPEAADRAMAWLDAHGRAFGHFIGGAFTDAAAGERFETANPATARPLATVLQGTDEDVAAAVAAARAAQPGWWAVGPHVRARHLYALARRVQKHARLFAVLETLDNGKPIRESRDLDIPLVARHFYHHAGWAQLMPEELPGYTPVGVVGQIIPWNFPLLMLAWKIAPALAMGNAVVLKPAEFTPLTALLFAELCRDAGLPPGVVNVVTGDGRTGAALVAHPDVDKIAFTGSTEVGRAIREATAGSGKRLSLELGGKSPFVVFDDADLDSVVEGVVDAIWFNQGQVCCAGSRILVQEGVAGGARAQAAGAHGDAAHGRSARQGGRHGRDRRAGAARSDPRAGRAGPRRGRGGVAAVVERAEGGVVLPAHAVHRVRPLRDAGPGGGVRAGGGAHDLPHALRGGGARQRHALRPGRLDLVGEHQPRPRRGAEDQGRHRVDQLHEPLRRGVGVRRLPGERLRA